MKEESQNDELTNHLRETFKESATTLSEKRIRHVALGGLTIKLTESDE
ncbi:hypothetical protein KE480_16785 [Enterococcus sp. 079]|nr:hypothetical protein [Enterococcus sp. 079]